MYERFTGRARKVMQLAEQAARETGFDAISTFHIAIGVLREGSGVACNALRNSGISLDVSAQRLLDGLVYRLPSVPPSCRLPLSDTAKGVVELAIKWAKDRGNTYVGTEHLMYAALASSSAVVSIVCPISQFAQAVDDLLQKKPAIEFKPGSCVALPLAKGDAQELLSCLAAELEQIASAGGMLTDGAGPALLYAAERARAMAAAQPKACCLDHHDHHGRAVITDNPDSIRAV